MGLRLWGMCDIIVQGGGHTVSPEIPFPRQSPILNKTSVQQLPICTRPVDNRIPSRASITFPLKPMWQTAYLIEVTLLLLFPFLLNNHHLPPSHLFEGNLNWQPSLSFLIWDYTSTRHQSTITPSLSLKDINMTIYVLSSSSSSSFDNLLLPRSSLNAG